ncbi:MAG: DUF456 domain-containing protein [Thermomonas sp.]|uniref:DUF456 domain-containing protein n=1 Tax=Thermomonas sp. TaxID=1971895 RepID=UPI00261B51A4|nr:DUF456 domain-containing protein [Thermomonas sp.]MCC7096731.1 DUF456 domain-containing protein [Thermomonas sp.]
MDWNVVLYALAALLMLLGVVGTVLPALPGVPLVYAGMLLAAWADGFQRVGAAMLILLGTLTLLSVGLDLWATAHGAGRVGASRLAMLGAALGTLVGVFFALPGLILGPFIGALAGELVHLRSTRTHALGQAAKVGVGTWFGILLGILLKFTLSFTMLGLFALAWWL